MLRLSGGRIILRIDDELVKRALKGRRVIDPAWSTPRTEHPVPYLRQGPSVHLVTERAL